MACEHLLSVLLSLDSVKLGRLVLNAKCAHQDLLDPFENGLAEAEFVRTVQHDFSGTRKFSKLSKLRSSLSTALSASYQVHEASSQRFLEKAFDNQADVYLIVGFRAVHNALIVRSATRNRTGSAIGEAHLEAVTGGIMVLGVGGTRSTRKGQELVCRATGDQVFAKLYRKVKLKFLSRRKAGNMALEVGNRWKSCWDWRDYEIKKKDDEDEDDIVEAALTDSDLDISDDDYPSEDEIEVDPLLQELGDRSIREDVREGVHQTFPEETSGMMSEAPLEVACSTEAVVGEEEDSGALYEGCC
ncbi:hypothetical protein DFP73DRAFT_635907 [Morchella snyderi]|nr:hypothetical protein DFP73DRAFT_635907 [Morchella snyderi]